MNDRKDRPRQSDETSDEPESLEESLAALLDAGLIQWSGGFRDGRPVFIAVQRERTTSPNEATPPPPEDPRDRADTGDWEGEVGALWLIAPILADDEAGCDRTFCSKREAFCAGLTLGHENASGVRHRG